MTGQEIFRRKKLFTRRNYFIVIGLIFIYFVWRYYAHWYIFSSISHDIEESKSNFLIVEILIGVGVLFWISSLKEVNELTIDNTAKNIHVNYVTIFKQNNFSSIPFNELSIENKSKKAFRSNVNKWVLRIFSNGDKVFKIKEDADGFSKDDLDKIEHCLKSLRIKSI